MPNALIAGAVRTPVGARNGALQHWHPADLAAETLNALVERASLDASIVDDVILGCVTTTGEQSGNIARAALLAAGWPERVPGVTVDRHCASSQQALHFAVALIESGSADVVVAGGVESMSKLPLGADVLASDGLPFGPRVANRYRDDGGLMPWGVVAERAAARAGITRAEVDAAVVQSRSRARDAADAGRFSPEIVALDISGTRMDRDELIQSETSESTFPPLFESDGVLSATSVAPAADGAAALLLVSEEAAQRHVVAPLTRVVSTAAVACGPLDALSSGAAATRVALERAKLRLEEIDVAEVHEAFGCSELVWRRELDQSPRAVNPNGGALAIGDPAGAASARASVTLVHELARRSEGFAIQATSASGGIGLATVFERWS